MQFDLVSDLHFEKADISNYETVLPMKNNNLNVAGDVSNGEEWEIIVGFFAVACAKYDSVWYVMGNHEYYNTSRINMNHFEDRIEKLKKIHKNLFFLNNTYQYLKEYDLVIYGGVLWSEANINNFPNNFHLYMDGKNISFAQWNKLHYECLVKMEEAYHYAESKNAKMMVITHFAPVVKEALDPKYYGHYKNILYTTDLSKYFNPRIVSWVFGHTGYNCDIIKNGTRIVSNQFRVKNGKKYDKNITINV
jgi:hypothetical protein